LLDLGHDAPKLLRKRMRPDLHEGGRQLAAVPERPLLPTLEPLLQIVAMVAQVARIERALWTLSASDTRRACSDFFGTARRTSASAPCTRNRLDAAVDLGACSSRMSVA
jgi:hypothetical protein